MKKQFLALITILILAFSLTGCGGGGDSTASGTLGIGTGDTGGTPGDGSTPPITDPTLATVGDVSIVFGSGSTSETLIANGSDFRLVRATVRDIDGVAIPSKTVSFTTTAGSFSPSSTATTDVNGLAQINFVAPNILGSATLRANADGVTSDSISADFVPGTPAAISLFAAPLQVQPTGVSTLDVRVTDSNDFPVANETITFTFTQQGSGLPLVTPAFPKTDANGQVSVTYTAGASGGTTLVPLVDTIQAQTANGALATISIEVATDAVVVSNLTLTGTNTVAVGNSVGITAKITSASGTPELIPVTFTLDDFSLGDLNGANVPVIDPTNINGEAFATFNAGTAVGTVTVSATASGFTKTLVIDLTAGAPASLALTAAPNPVSVASPQNLNQADIVATITDANGNPVPGENVSFNIFIVDNNTGGSVAPSATTNLSGVARVIYAAGGTPGTDTITAEATSSSVSGTVDISAQADISKVASILINADKTVLSATGTANIVVTALDNVGNPVSGVLLGAASTGGTLSGNAATNSVGEVSLALAGTVAEDVTLTVTAGTLAVQEQFFFGPTLKFVPDAVSGIGEVTLTVRLLNGSGVPIEGIPITFPIVASVDEITEQLDFVTKANGTAEVKVTDPDTGGTVEISANSGAVTTATNATVSFQTAADTFSISAVADNTALTTGGNSDVTVTVVNITDGTPAGSIPLNVAVTGTAVANPATGSTNASGQFVTNITDAVDEDVTITITDDSGSLSIEVPLFFGATLELFPPTATGIADGTTPTELQAVVRSSAGAGIGNTPVDFAVTTGSAIISGSRIFTDASGVALVNVTDSVIESDAAVTASSGTAPSDTTVIDFKAGDPATLTLVAGVGGTQIPLFSNTTITATVTDVLGNNVTDNTAVSFTTTGGSVTATVPTSGGAATTIFDGGNVSGLYTVTATAGTVSNTIDIEVLPLDAGIIKVESVTPESVQVLGTTGEQTSTIRFLVQDAAGNPVDGEIVYIFLDPNQLGGGESISSGGSFGTKVSATTANGIAQVTVRSGAISGTLDITALVDPDIEDATQSAAILAALPDLSSNPGTIDGDEFSTVAQVTIVGGVADGAHLTLAASTLNLAGGLYVDLPSTVTAIVADRFSNIVPDGTNVSFESECGRIGESAGFTTSTQQGQAQAVFRTSNPMIPDDLLGGPAPAGRTGLCRVMAYTTGDESYYDANGNGVFDTGDTCTGDLSEPFIDANDNGIHEDLEFYVDVDNNGIFTAANSTCDSDTTIWTSMNLLMSDHFALEVDTSPSGGALSVDLAVGESQQYAVTFGDTFDNSLVAGTTLAVEKVQGTGGLITGTTGLTLGDGTGTDNTVYFTVSSDSDPDATPETLEIGVTLGSSATMLNDPITGSSTSNNNGISFTRLFTVNINQPPPPTPPTVIWTVPAAGATNVPVNAEMTVAFSEDMTYQTISTTTIQTTCGGIPYNFASVGAFEGFAQWVFSHASGSTFPAGTTCNVTVTTGVLDAEGTALAAEHTFSFGVQ